MYNIIHFLSFFLNQIGYYYTSSYKIENKYMQKHIIWSPGTQWAGVPPLKVIVILLLINSTN